MSILVNGNLTWDFQVGQGLRQGDPISTFLFLMTAEGFTSLVRHEVQTGEYQSFKVNDEVNFQILQFADDNVNVSEGSQSNIWSIKAILHGFELALGLPVNLYKSKLLIKFEGQTHREEHLGTRSQRSCESNYHNGKEVICQ